MSGLPFLPGGDHTVVVDLQDGEQEVLTNLIVDLRHLLMADSHDALRRLKPPAHADNAEAEAAYRELVDDDLLRSRLDLLDTVEAGVGGATLDEDGIAAWMQALNMMRLVLGERLELDGVDLVADDLPDGPASFLFQWVGELLELLVRAVSVSGR
ncbi:MAG: DUF2017 family protein [Acidimicrobiales bacterium]